jgi:hypothetical protein
MRGSECFNGKNENFKEKVANDFIKYVTGKFKYSGRCSMNDHRNLFPSSYVE